MSESAQPGAGEWVSAKPLKWTQASATEWHDEEGFYITFDAEDDDLGPYSAMWGEGDSERFATLEKAQQWCHDELTRYVRRIAASPQQAAPAQSYDYNRADLPQAAQTEPHPATAHICPRSSIACGMDRSLWCADCPNRGEPQQAAPAAGPVSCKYPHCSGDPQDCPENEGFGCCQRPALERPTTTQTAQQDKPTESAPVAQGQAALRKALQKLVDLQDMRERAEKINPVEAGYEKEVLLDLYRQGIRAAWPAARRALATSTQAMQTEHNFRDSGNGYVCKRCGFAEGDEPDPNVCYGITQPAHQNEQTSSARPDQPDENAKSAGKEA